MAVLNLKRRMALRSAVLLTIAAQAAATAPPKVLIFTFADDFGWYSTGYHGN